jgi:hypothetical protein
MLRFAAALSALLLAAGGLLAEEVKGKVKSVDADKNQITVTVSDKDTTYDVAKFAVFSTLVGKGKKAQPQELTGGLKAVEAGQDVTLTVEKKDDKDLVTKLQVEPAMKKKKNN